MFSSKYISSEVLCNLTKILLSQSGFSDCINKNYIIIKDNIFNIKSILKTFKKIDTIKSIHLIYIQMKNINGKYIKKILNKLYTFGFFDSYINY